jgi:Rieske Fe-S protein
MSDVDGRRRLLGWIAAGLGAGLASAVAAPIALFVGGQARRAGELAADEEAVDAGAIGALPDGKPVRVTLRARRRRDAFALRENVVLGAAWLVRRGGAVAAFSTVCPHAGCAVEAEEGGAFSCPCHKSRFGPDGARLDGPAPRGLDPLPVAVVDGRVRVTPRRFRQGTKAREPV